MLFLDSSGKSLASNQWSNSVIGTGMLSYIKKSFTFRDWIVKCEICNEGINRILYASMCVFIIPHSSHTIDLKKRERERVYMMFKLC